MKETNNQPDLIRKAAGENHGPANSTPRWVYLFGIIAVVLVLLFIVMHITGNSPGGPNGHKPSSASEQGLK